MNHVDGAIADLQEQVNQLKAKNNNLDKVASDLQDLCDRQARMISERDAVLKMALGLFDKAGTDAEEIPDMMNFHWLDDVPEAMDAIRKLLK